MGKSSTAVFGSSLLFVETVVKRTDGSDMAIWTFLMWVKVIQTVFDPSLQFVEIA